MAKKKRWIGADTIGGGTSVGGVDSAESRMTFEFNNQRLREKYAARASARAEIERLKKIGFENLELVPGPDGRLRLEVPGAKEPQNPHGGKLDLEG